MWWELVVRRLSSSQLLFLQSFLHFDDVTDHPADAAHEDAAGEAHEAEQRDEDDEQLPVLRERRHFLGHYARAVHTCFADGTELSHKTVRTLAEHMIERPLRSCLHLQTFPSILTQIVFAHLNSELSCHGPDHDVVFSRSHAVVDTHVLLAGVFDEERRALHQIPRVKTLLVDHFPGRCHPHDLLHPSTFSARTSQLRLVAFWNGDAKSVTFLTRWLLTGLRFVGFANAGSAGVQSQATAHCGLDASPTCLSAGCPFTPGTPTPLISFLPNLLASEDTIVLKPFQDCAPLVSCLGHLLGENFV